MKPDFGLTAGDYSRHRAGFPDSLFGRLQRFGVGLRGQSLVDLGTGTGSLARGFARRGCRVIGLDPSDALMREARRLDAEAGVSVEYREGRAEATGLPDDSADVVTAGQCWHWFDRPAAAREVARVLRASGVLVIAHFDWIARRGNAVEATEQLIVEHNPQWRFANLQGIYPAWLRDLGEAGYREIESFSYDVEAAYTPEDWRGRVRASAGIGASLSPEKVEAFDAALVVALQERFPDPVLAMPHRVFAVVARPPPAS